MSLRVLRGFRFLLLPGWAITSVPPRKKISENCFYTASNFPYAHGCELATSRILKAQGSPQEEAVEIGNS
jgi:hypothetical protein